MCWCCDGSIGVNTNAERIGMYPFHINAIASQPLPSASPWSWGVATGPKKENT